MPASGTAVTRLLLVLILSGAALPALAQIPPPADPAAVLSKSYRGKSFSPYAGRPFPSRPLWGDTHLHTGNSFDAGAFGNRLGLEEAYRFARGEEVVSSTGIPVRLSRPLDWLVVADHSDNMGFFLDLLKGAPNILSDPQGKAWYDRIQTGDGVAVAYELINLFANGKFPENLTYGPESAQYKSVWQRTIDAAEAFNEPGRFTAFIGYEWTSLVQGNNMHRVVIYRDGAAKAAQAVPYTTYPPLGSPNPRDLWQWLTRFEERTGGDVLAIAHNGNMSNGIMFPLDAQYDGRVLDASYVTERAKWEPLYEVTQIKGDGEAHPFLSPDDEFADYETWDIGNLDTPTPAPKTDDMLAGEYAREALKRGLAIEARLGTNPYKFGMIGSTDSHTSLSTAEEDNFFGKHSGMEPSPDRMEHAVMSNSRGTLMGYDATASGLAAVWAPENTREAIFDAMQRKEVYATTGSRMGVRFFGGWDYTEEDLQSRTPAFAGYDKGVPMGADLPRREGRKSPTFMVFALRDPIGANLDRIQIVKGWLDSAGGTQEKVYDVAWSGDRRIGSNGKLPAVGNTVDAKKATFTNTIGAPELGTVWTDPDFDPAQRAFYYARVIEIPTPRWSTIEAFRFGIPVPKGAPVSTQERAYTAPIWYTP
ncbi:MAG TPA: DUF3604 domain-containing protein [Steroidobacteraceae bacterium]|nr:DUF3604 domain-containing protein [Steroidobacteraceae bacterium]